VRVQKDGAENVCCFFIANERIQTLTVWEENKKINKYSPIWKSGLSIQANARFVNISDGGFENMPHTKKVV